MGNRYEQVTPSIKEFCGGSEVAVVEDSNELLRIVIADLHASYSAFYNSLGKGSEFFSRLNPVQKPELILLGDLFDRGRSAREVLENVVRLLDSNHKVTLLAGNHEMLMFNAVYNPSFDSIYGWVVNGGYETFRSLAALVDDQLDEKQWSEFETACGVSAGNGVLLYNFYLSVAESLKTMLSELGEHSMIKQLFRSLNLTTQRGSDLYVHAGFSWDFVSNNADFGSNNWSVELNNEFRSVIEDCLADPVVSGWEINLKKFVSATKDMMGPLWVHKSYFDKMPIVYRRLLKGAMNRISVRRMVVGHSVVSAPELDVLQSDSHSKFEILYLDCGISEAFRYNMNAQCLVVDGQGGSFVLNKDGDFVQI